MNFAQQAFCKSGAEVLIFNFKTFISGSAKVKLKFSKYPTFT